MPKFKFKVYNFQKTSSYTTSIVIITNIALGSIRFQYDLKSQNIHTSSPPEFHLVPFEVLLIFDNFNKSLQI